MKGRKVCFLETVVITVNFVQCAVVNQIGDVGFLIEKKKQKKPQNYAFYANISQLLHSVVFVASADTAF